MSGVFLSIWLLSTFFQVPEQDGVAPGLQLEAPVQLPELSVRDRAKLRSLTELIDQQPVFLSLVAIDEIAQMSTPWSIVTLSDLLDEKLQRWLVMQVLLALEGRSVEELVQFGGQKLYRRLDQFRNLPYRAIQRRAYFIRARIDKHLVPVEGLGRVFPPPLQLPSGPQHGDPQQRGETVVVAKKKGGRGGNTAAGSRTESLGEGIDLVWAFDVTGSMQQYLAGSIETVTKLEQILTPLLGEVRWGCVVYRDRVEGMRPLGNDWERFRYSLEMLVARDGGGPNERVDRALAAALSSKMGWSRDRNGAVIFFADAAPKQIHSRSVPQQLSKLLRKWRNLRVHAVRFGHATMGGPTVEFWRRLTSAGGGRSLEYKQHTRSHQQLLEAILISVFPQKERQQIDRILATIAAVEQWQPLLRNTGKAIPSPF